MFASIRALALAIVALTAAVVVGGGAAVVDAQTVGDPCQVKQTPLCKRMAARWDLKSVWKAGGGAQLAMGFHEFGVLHPGHGNGYQGAVALTQYFDRYLLAHFTNATFKTQECGFTDNTAGAEQVWERGTYEFGGAQGTEVGSYMAMWVTGPNGKTLVRRTLITHKGALPVLKPVAKGATAAVPANVSPSTILNVTTVFEAMYFTRQPLPSLTQAVYLPNTLVVADEHTYFGHAAVESFYTQLQTGVATVAIQLQHTYSGGKAAFFAATGTFRLIAGPAESIEGATYQTGAIMLVGYVDAKTGRPGFVRQMTVHNKNQ